MNPDGRVSYDWVNSFWNNSQNGYNTIWTNTGSGFTNNWGGSMDYDASPTNFYFGGTSTGIPNSGSGSNLPTINLPTVYLTGKSSGWGNTTQNHFNSYMSYWNGGSGYPEIRRSYYNPNPYVSSDRSDWYTPGGRANWGLATAAASLENFSGKTRITTYGDYAKIYRTNPNGRIFYGNQYVKTTGLSKIGGMVGRLSFGIGVTMDSYAWYNGDISDGKFILNTTIGAIGAWGGIPGAILSTSYFGVDAFYPGGWDGAMNDTAVRQAEFDRVINTNSGMAPQYIFPYGSQKF